jgi:predicted aldo/keto reductase-like oxidoreductase
MLSKPFEWDSVQMPINALDAHFRSFQKGVVPRCTRRDIGVIGMKALAGGTIPTQLKIDAVLCRRFALSLPISTLVCGIRSPKDLRQDLALARDFQPLVPDEIELLLSATKVPASDGKLEPFKTTKYGSAYHARQHSGL